MYRKCIEKTKEVIIEKMYRKKLKEQLQKKCIENEQKKV